MFAQNAWLKAEKEAAEQAKLTEELEQRALDKESETTISNLDKTLEVSVDDWKSLDNISRGLNFVSNGKIVKERNPSQALCVATISNETEMKKWQRENSKGLINEILVEKGVVSLIVRLHESKSIHAAAVIACRFGKVKSPKSGEEIELNSLYDLNQAFKGILKFNLK